MWLEKTGRIDTRRLDDTISYAPVQLLTPFTADGKRYLRLTDLQITPAEFLAAKPPDVFRIFVLGESFAAGTPYNLTLGTDTEGTPAGWLQVLTQIRFPRARVEVISAAAGGATSNRVREIAAILLAEASPDLLVIATGNNEGFVPGRLNEELHRWVVYRALKRTLLAEPARNERPANMPRMDGIDDAFTALDRNLESILSEAARRGVRVVLCTLPANLKFDIRPSSASLGGLAPEYLEADEALESGRAKQAAGDFEAALQDFARSRNRGIVLLHIGECLEAMGRFDDAREAYRRQLQNAPVCRPGWGLNERIREKSTRPGVALADLENAVARIAPHEITNFSLFYDSCHVRWFVNYHVADAMLKAAIRGKFLPSDWGDPIPAPPVDQALRIAKWSELPDRAIALNRQYELFQGNHFDVTEDPRKTVPLAFEAPSPDP